MDDIDDIFRDSNDGAYVKEQVRTGPPLEYVSEKTRRALESLHGAMLRLPGGSDGRREVAAAFMYTLVAHLALNNMLALFNETGAQERLLGMSKEDFEQWLERVDREGLTSG